MSTDDDDIEYQRNWKKVEEIITEFREPLTNDKIYLLPKPDTKDIIEELEDGE